MKSDLEGREKGHCQVSGLDGGPVKVDGGTINYDKTLRQRRRFWGTEGTF